MFHMGVPELVLILIIGLVIFGPGKLPGVGKALGQSIREFRGRREGQEHRERHGGVQGDRGQGGREETGLTGPVRCFPGGKSPGKRHFTKKKRKFFDKSHPSER